MALALLERDAAETGLRFRYDVGKNRFFRYVIGKGRQRRRDGLEIIEEAAFESELVGPVPPEQMGRGALTIDTDKISRDNRLVQLWSFRSANGAGPAVSAIIDTGLMTTSDEELPAITFSEVRVMPATRARALDTVPFRYREAPQFSNAMFLDAIGGLLSGLVPQIGPLIGSLLGGGAAAPAPAPAGTAAPAVGGAPAAPGLGGPLGELLKQIANPDTLKHITDLIKGLQGAASGSSQAKSLAMSAIPSGPLPRCRDQYSQAQFEPMTIIAGLTQLAPLLSKVLTPETIGAVLDAPNKHIGTIINGVLDFAKLGIQDAEKFREHLRALNPGVEDPGFNQLIATVTQGLSVAPEPLNYARVGSVSLEFVHGGTVTLGGRNRVVYKHGSALAFPLNVQTPQTIRQGTVQLEIKDARTLAVHHQSRYRVEQVSSGPMLTVPTVTETESARMTANRDYIVCATLVWKNKEGQARGTSMQQEITLAGEYTYDRIDESSELIPLDDAERFRDYWHRIWEGTMEDGVKRIELDAKYYFILAPGRHNHARIETRSNLTAEEKRLGGRLKSGMELSPAGLNQLLTELDPMATPLDDGQMLALTAPEFAERFQQAARYRAVLRGRSGDHASLWVYPEFKIQVITLQQATQTDEHGQVLELQPAEVRFPIPALLHFIGVRSE
jgi:hypothetical protein